MIKLKKASKQSSNNKAGKINQKPTLFYDKSIALIKAIFI